MKNFFSYLKDIGTTRTAFICGCILVGLLTLIFTFIYAIGFFLNLDLEKLDSLKGFILWLAPLIGGLKLGDAIIEYKEEESEDKVDIALGKRDDQ